jgi:GAF domain-containing protein
VLQRVLEVAVERVPHAEHAGITLGRKGRFATIAGTGELVEQVDGLQYRLKSGPCVDAVIDDTIYRPSDLRTDPRWPEFGRQAYEVAGILSMMSMRLFMESDQDVIAGLNMYSTDRDAFTDDDQRVALLLATHGALALNSVRAHQQVAHLNIALHSNRNIGVAIGVLMSLYKVTQEQAFDLMRMASQATHRKLADIASDVTETGELPKQIRRDTSP